MDEYEEYEEPENMRCYFSDALDCLACEYNEECEVWKQLQYYMEESREEDIKKMEE